MPEESSQARAESSPLVVPSMGQVKIAFTSYRLSSPLLLMLDVHVLCRGFPRRIVVEVGSLSTGEPPRRWSRLLPPSTSVAGLGWHAPWLRALLLRGLPMLSATEVEALRKE
jgi:hypothetical protein